LVVFPTHNPETRFQIEVVDVDKLKDLAVLRLDGRNISALQAQQYFMPKKGVAVHAAGFPRYAMGVSLWEDAGKIVRIRDHPAYPRWYVNFAIVTGASGSPVMVDGKVVGIASEGAENFAKGAAKVGLGLNDEPDFGVIPIASLYEMVGRGNDPQS
jgi:hypothetical protein